MIIFMRLFLFIAATLLCAYLSISSPPAFAIAPEEHSYFDLSTQLCIETENVKEIPHTTSNEHRYISLSECRKNHPELLLKRAAGILLWPLHILFFGIFSFLILKVTTKISKQQQWNIFFLLSSFFSLWIFFLYSISTFFSNTTFDDFFIKRHEALRSLIIVTFLFTISSMGLFIIKYMPIKHGKT